MRLLQCLALVGALLLSACTSDADGSPTAEPSTTAPTTPTATPTPPPPPPRLGDCYRLSYDEAVAPTNEDEPVPCGKGHTSQTFAVGRLDLVANGHLLAVDSDAVLKQVSQRCPRRLAEYVGATPEQLRLSLLRPVWFTPTIEQADAGADWYRCDVIAVTGDETVAKIDHDLSKALKTEAGRTEFGMCGTAQPGTREFSQVLCREDHSWKAITAVDLTDLGDGDGRKKRRYPGEKAVRNAGEDGTCADAARAIASDALDYEWGYEWPTKDQWRAGQTYGRCWSPDPA